MRFHHALVDDLIPESEFNERVEEKIEACGGLVDEPTAAMLVVGDMGRAHRKIRDLSGGASLVCFFGRVLGVSPSRTFVRADGEEGTIATVILGDETGRVEMALFDEKADAVSEIEVGEVLEVIARPSTRKRGGVTGLALQKSGCEIDCPVPSGGSVAGHDDQAVDLAVRFLRVRPPRTFSRRDGTPGSMIEALVGNEEGVFRLVAWQPDLLEGIGPGDSVRVTGAQETRRSDRVEYSVDEGSAVEAIEGAVEVRITPLGALQGEGTVSVRGSVSSLQPPRQFVARSGEPSFVRNIVLVDGSGEAPVVLWGEHALLPLAPGDLVEVYGGAARPGRYGDLEVSAGWSAAVVTPAAGEVAITIEGTVFETPAGLFIDGGVRRYLLEADGFRMGDELRVEGRLLGNRLLPEAIAPASLDPGTVRQRLAALGRWTGDG
ncbi:MAG: nucleic acid-binding protein [Methanospirillum sp.]|nr:nucleic acid-binding protein [Methanospirillum sp.]